MAGPHVSPPSSPIQEIVATERRTTAAPSSTSNPSVKDKGKSQVQDSGAGSADLESFAAKHLNMVQNVADPEYTRSLTAFMNSRKDKKLLEGVGNALFLSAGMVFQQLEDLQSMEDELKEARTSSEKLQQEKIEVSTALGVERARLVSLEKEKSLAIREKASALEAKELALAAREKLEEEKARLDEERQQAIERADKAETQNSELQAKLQRLEAELQVFMIYRRISVWYFHCSLC